MGGDVSIGRLFFADVVGGHHFLSAGHSVLIVLRKNSPLTYKMIILLKDAILLVLIPWRPQASE